MHTRPMTDIPTRLYHGSYAPFEPGFVLTARPGYEEAWGGTDFYAALERWRPEGCLPHRGAVFMVADPNEIDLAGGATEWCLEVEPEGRVSRHDLNWGSEVSCLVSDGHAVDSPEVRAAAEAYWRGDRSPNEVVWEYLAPSARVVRCEPYETFGLDGSPSP